MVKKADVTKKKKPSGKRRPLGGFVEGDTDDGFGPSTTGRGAIVTNAAEIEIDVDGDDIMGDGGLAVGEAAADPQADEEQEEGGKVRGKNKTGLSSGLRKLLKKELFHQKLAASKEVLKAQQTIKKKRSRGAKGGAPPGATLTNFSDLLDTLNDIGVDLDEDTKAELGRAPGGATAAGAAGKAARKRAAKAATASRIKGTSSRGRQLILETEKQRSTTILRHPAFKANPLGSILAHLTSTMPPPPEPGAGKQRVASTNGSARRKQAKLRAKAQSGGEMDE